MTEVALIAAGGSGLGAVSTSGLRLKGWDVAILSFGRGEALRAALNSSGNRS